MPKYRVYFTTGASSSVVVEAEDRSDAIDKASDEFAYPSICAQCSGWGQDYSMDLGEWEPDMSDEGVEEVS
jgi:hypothetical protein